MTAAAKPILAILGGTGQEGRALALRWAHAGYPVIIGSRDAAKAAAPSGRGVVGGGMKFKNPSSPKTTRGSPISIRATAGRWRVKELLRI